MSKPITKNKWIIHQFIFQFDNLKLNRLNKIIKYFKLRQLK
jgi:hypothetical protein